LFCQHVRHACLIILLASLAAAVPAAGAPTAKQAPEPWATVNVCDTADRPNEMGIRGSMPGLERPTTMYMRFRVQFRDPDGRFRLVKRGADSGWQRVAVGRGDEHDSGWTFEFKPPKAGGAHVLRGLVTFEWRRAGRVLQRDRVTTEPGHPGTAGADPEDFSAKTCEIA
jgi:hypothetical protein